MRRGIWLLVFWMLTVAGGRSASQVVVNEIMYHDARNDPTEEFLELYNAEAEEVGLEGWQLTAGITFVFPEGVVIDGGGYLVVCGDEGRFRSRHPEVLNVVGDFTGRLSNGRERITLLDRVSNVVDSVQYGDSYPWPWTPDGGGPSLELIHPSLDNDVAASWEGSTVSGGTPGAANSVLSRQSPVPDAGEDQFVAEGATVLLDGSGSSDADGEIVSFTWMQTGGPEVRITGGETPRPRFDAPEVAENTSLRFELTVVDDDGQASSSSVEVVVINVEGRAMSGTLAVDTVWDAANSPYVIVGDVTVPEETTLRIEAGAVVQLFPRGSITVRGVLTAEGTEDREILFGRVAGIDAGWGCVRLEGSQGSVLRHCVLEYGRGAAAFSSSIPERSAFYATDSEVTVEHCTFRFFDDYVLTAEDSVVTVSDSVFYETGEGINLTNCVAAIRGNRMEGVRNGDDAIDINADWAHASPTPVVIEGNTVLRGSGDGIDLGGCSPLIRGNLIYLCADKGISLGEGSDARIENNIPVHG